MIKSARIATYGERAVDAFYVQDPLGMKIESKQKLRAIEKKLLAALEDGECAPAPRPGPQPGTQKTAKKPEAAPDSVGRRADTARAGTRKTPARRSEEHTSELQSLMRISYAVFCLKKKTTHKEHRTQETAA